MSRPSLSVLALRSFVPILLMSLVSAAILATAGAAATRVAGGSTGLVAAYAFDEGSGATAADASGNANTAKITGASWSTAGQYGGALSFNGTSNSVQAADSASLDL